MKPTEKQIQEWGTITNFQIAMDVRIKMLMKEGMTKDNAMKAAWDELQPIAKERLAEIDKQNP